MFFVVFFTAQIWLFKLTIFSNRIGIAVMEEPVNQATIDRAESW